MFLRRIAVVEAGYIGLTTDAFLASLGHRVVCADVDAGKVAELAEGGRGAGRARPGGAGARRARRRAAVEYAANGYMAVTLSYVTALAELCERVGADVTAVTGGIGRDRRNVLTQHN